MANERLRAAMERSNVSITELATLTEKDNKTVGRWLGGRLPHPRTRAKVARRLDEDEEFLWPGAKRRTAEPTMGMGEIVASHPYRSDLPRDAWWKLITRAKRQIDLLGYTLYFLALEHPQLIETLQAKCANGCRVRAVIADPTSRYVADRDAEEQQPITLVARIHTTLKYFKPLINEPSDTFELRYQDVPLYNSVFRFDDEMLVTPHLLATPGSSAPVLHLRRLGPNGMFSRFAEHFEGVWTRSVRQMKGQPGKQVRS